MKIYAVMFCSEAYEDTWPLAYFKDRETAEKQFRMIRGYHEGDGVYVDEIEVLDEPQDIDLHGQHPDGVELKIYDEEDLKKLYEGLVE